MHRRPDSRHTPRIDAEAENRSLECRLMGESKNGTQPRIKRIRGMRKVAAANADHSTAQETAARGHRSAAAPRAWHSQYTDTHKPEPYRQSAKKRAPAHTGAGAHPETICFFTGAAAGGCLAPSFPPYLRGCRAVSSQY